MTYVAIRRHVQARRRQAQVDRPAEAGAAQSAVDRGETAYAAGRGAQRAAAGEAVDEGLALGTARGVQVDARDGEGAAQHGGAEGEECGSFMAASLRGRGRSSDGPPRVEYVEDLGHADAGGSGSLATYSFSATWRGTGRCSKRPCTTRSGPAGRGTERVTGTTRNCSRPCETTRAISVTLRELSAWRVSWTTTSTAESIWSFSASKGIWTSDIEPRVWSLMRASSAWSSAWTVARDPS